MTRIQFNVITGYVAMVWNALMGLIFIPVYLHFLGVEAYGLIGIFASLQVWFAVLDFGLLPAINREMARFEAGVHTRARIRTLFNTLEVIFIAVGVALGFLVISGSGWIASRWLNVQHLPLATVAATLKIVGVTVAVRWVAGLYRSAITGLQRHAWLNAVTIGFATARGLGAVALLAFVNPSIVVFFWYQAGITLLEALLFALQIRRWLPRTATSARFAPQALRSIGNFAAGMAGITVLATILTQVDKLLLSRLVSLEEFGAYSLAYSICLYLLHLVYPIDSAASPRFCELIAAGRSTELAQAYRNFSQLLAVILVPAAAVLAVFSDHILLVWTRNPTMVTVVAPLVSLIAIGTLLNGLMHVPYALQIASGWPQFTFAANTIALGLLVPAIYFGVTRLGLVAGPVAWILLNLGYVAVAVGLMHRRLLPSEKGPWYTHGVIRPIGVALAVTFTVRLLAPAADLHAPISAAAVVAGAAVLTVVATALATPVGRAVIVATGKWAAHGFSRTHWHISLR